MLCRTGRGLLCSCGTSWAVCCKSDMVEAGLTKVLATRSLQVRVAGSSRMCSAGKTGGYCTAVEQVWPLRSDMVQAGLTQVLATCAVSEVHMSVA
jgi:hypothetical protein